VVVMRRVKQKPHKICKHRANIQEWSSLQRKQCLRQTCHHIGQEFYSIRLRISNQSGHRFFAADRRSCPFFRIHVFFCAGKEHKYSYKVLCLQDYVISLASANKYQHSHTSGEYFQQITNLQTL
jgi:hypothetical protein